MSQQNRFKAFHDHLKKAKHVSCVAALANWDQEVHMPEKSANFRSEQLSYLAGWHHQLLTDGYLLDLIEDLKSEDNLDEVQQRNVAIVQRDIRKAELLPKAFVERLSKATSEANHAWVAAREKEDFSAFSEQLKTLVELNKEKADYYGYQDNIYEGLLDDFEPGLTTNALDEIMQRAKKSLTHLLDQIKQQPQADTGFMYQRFPVERQDELNRQLAAELGFNFKMGVLNTSKHPFTISFSPEDVRITTRFFEHDFPESLGSTVHETGHALYEQGFLAHNYGLPAGEAISLGIHESQSRLYENNVGRSKDFIRGFLPLFKQYFPEQLGPVSEEQFYQAFNQVKPSLIRTAADEVTYHLHIFIRMELEKALLEDRLTVEELPEAWNAAYRDYLGLTPKDLKEGVLQDIHWAHGAFGYFPTYSLGSFYAAQFYHQAQKAIPELNKQLANRQTSSLLHWLRENLHQYGRLYESSEICQAISGEPLRFDYFEDYIYRKYSDLYQLA